MDKRILEAKMKQYGDTQVKLAEAMGISFSRLNAKINQRGADFTLLEVNFIIDRYHMNKTEAAKCFFTRWVS